jgi:hypothetical protein
VREVGADEFVQRQVEAVLRAGQGLGGQIRQGTCAVIEDGEDRFEALMFGV